VLELVLQPCQLFHDFLALSNDFWVRGRGGGAVDIVNALSLGTMSICNLVENFPTRTIITGQRSRAEG